MSRRALGLAAIVMSLPATVLFAPAVSAQSGPAQIYVAQAGASDLFEKQSGQLMTATTTNRKVRDFASMMIADHMKSTADVKAAAAQDKVKVGTPRLDGPQRKMLSDLGRKKGADRDTLYIDQQKQAHAAALQLHQGYAANGTSEALKAAAAGIVPVVQQHIDTLNAM